MKLLGFRSSRKSHNYHCPTSVPTGRKGVTTIAAGEYTSIALGDFAPAILSGQRLTAFVGTPLLFQIQYSHNSTQFSSSAHPPGFTLDPQTGIIRGMPTASSSTTISVTANNEVGADTATIQVDIQVEKILTHTAGTGLIGIPYESQLQIASGHTTT